MKLIKKSLFTTAFSVFMIIINIYFSVIRAVGAVISVDSSFGGATSIDAAPNGVPLINLAAPTAGGVSVNHFREYNTGREGLILNNSVSAGLSELGGIIYGNPNYQQSGRAAGIVVNEVTGVNRSNLEGFTEMFGRSAEFVLINPNGIYVNGAGFINMPRVTLGAGHGVYASGNLAGINITDASLIFDGKGLNAEKVDYFDIVSRRIEINAPVYAKNLSANTGNGYYNYADKSFESSQGAERDFEYAIDASALGGIYAGRIYLISNEAGVGVRSVSDSLMADISDIVIRADGSVELKNASAAGGVDISASGAIESKGEIFAVKDVSLKGAEISNTGSVLSGRDMSLDAEKILNDKGLFFSGGDMDAGFQKLDNTYGDIYSMGDMRLYGADAKLINYSGSIESRGGMDVNLGDSGRLENTGKDRGGYTAELIYIGGHHRDTYGLMEEWRLNSSMTTDSSYLKSGGDMEIFGGEVINHGSVISSAGDLKISADYILNDTSSVDVYMGQLQHMGMVRREAKKIPGIKVTYGYSDKRYDYWTSGTLTAESADKGMLLAGGSLFITDTNGGGMEAGGNGLLENGRESESPVSRNTAAIDEILSSNAVNISSYVKIGENGSPMFNVNKDAAATYLIETRPEFIDINKFYGSRYFLERINYAPEEVKFLGDAFYEERLVSEAIMKAASKKFLFDDVDSDTAQMKRLLDNAVGAYNDLNLAVGVELTKEQITLLQEPIIWYVAEEIMGVTVLSPRLYIPDTLLDGFSSGGPVIAGSDVFIDMNGNVINSGDISGNGVLDVNALNIANNEGALMQGKDVNLTALGNIKNTGGVIAAQNDLSMVTRKGSVLNETVLHSQVYGRGNIASKTGDKALIYAGGNLLIDSGADFVNRGADVVSGGDANIAAAGDINFNAVAVTNVNIYEGKRRSGADEKITLEGSLLAVGGDLQMRSGGDTGFVASNAYVAGNADIETGGDFNLVNGYESFYSDITSKSGTLGSSKTTHAVDIVKTVAGSSFNTGNNMYVSSDGDINITGSQINAGGDNYLEAGGDINVTAAYDYEEHSFTVKKNNNGLRKKNREDSVLDVKVSGSELNVAQNFISLSAGDTNIEGSKINVGESADITAGGNINITAAYEQHEESHLKTSQGVGNGGMYGAKLAANGRGWTDAVGSLINADSLYMRSGGDILLLGSAIEAYYADIAAEGNFVEAAAQTASYEYSIKKKMTLNLDYTAILNAHRDFYFNFKNKMLKDLKDMFVKGKRVSLELMSGKYETFENRVNTQDLLSSVINAYLVKIDAGGDIDIKASDIYSGGSVSLTAGGNVNIESMDRTVNTTTKEFKGTAVVSVGAGHSVGAAYQADKELKKSIERLNKARKDFEYYENEIKPKAAQDYINGLIDDDEYNFIRDLSKYYKLNIAICTEDVYAKTMNAISATGTVGASMPTTLGFTFDARFDVDGTNKESSSFSSSAIGSNVYGAESVSIKAGGDVNIEGSNVGRTTTMKTGEGGEPEYKYAFSDSTSIEAQNVNITAARNTYENTTDEKHVNFNMSYGNGGTNAGVSGDVRRVDGEGFSYSNSHVGGDNVNINSAGDVTISGANVRAEDNLTLNVGGNLKVESLQDEDHNTESFVGMNFNIGEGSVSAGANIRLAEANKKWVNEQASITSGGRLDIDVAGNTNLAGGLIASDSKDMSFATGSLEYSNIKDTDRSYSVRIGFNVGASGISDQKNPDDKGANDADNGVAAQDNRDENKNGNANVSYGVNAGYEFGYAKQTNFATIGEGEITVRDGGGIDGLNRDVEKAQYTTLNPVKIEGGFEINEKTLHPVRTTIKAWEGIKAGYKELYEKNKDVIDALQDILSDLNLFESKTEREARLANEKLQKTFNGIMQSLQNGEEQIKNLEPEKLLFLIEVIKGSGQDIMAVLGGFVGSSDELNMLYAKAQNAFFMNGNEQISQGRLSKEVGKPTHDAAGKFTPPGSTACVFTSFYMLAKILLGDEFKLTYKEAWDLLTTTKGNGGKMLVSSGNAYINDRYGALDVLSGGKLSMSNTGKANGMTRIPSDYTLSQAVEIMAKGFDEGAIYHLRVGSSPNSSSGHSVVATGYYQDINGKMILTIGDSAGRSAYTHLDVESGKLFAYNTDATKRTDPNHIFIGYDIITKKEEK
ncbi:MAG: hemagglutinin repeat-containing protein [Leptospirales bacterium]|nr:hemagglutinin repeat-containing protein [Leptospirales bacterium]